ncbi:MBL fold metallo-hydrolase [Spirochaetia bacterium]|nr:MBL fold metallo-hydrolase [Spirochaetia bacterium]
MLGSGTSHGIPVVGCSCAVCRSHDERDRRLRTSLYIKGSSGARIVIDTGPEFRLQAIRAQIRHLDAVLLTHQHADHLHGLDDLRPLTWVRPLTVYGNELTIGEVKRRFAYIWKTTQQGGGKPRIDLNICNSSFDIKDLTITPIPVKHGDLDILGWKIKENKTEIAYITDCSNIYEESYGLLKNISVLIIDALRKHTHETHFNFEQAFDAIRKIDSVYLRKVFFTHISHEHSHAEITGICKQYTKKNNIHYPITLPSFDNLEIDV